MSILNNSLLLGADAAAGGYEISRSVRFNSSDSAYLSRTPASAGNRKTWTWAGWVKRANLTSDRYFLFGCGPDGNDFFAVEFGTGGDANKLLIQDYPQQKFIITTQIFRDPSAWYHIVIAVDTTQATNTDRIKIYVNGSQITAFSTYDTWTQNMDTRMNRAQPTAIGDLCPGFNKTFSGYLADIHFIDGQALTPSSFGESDTNGVWQPIDYAGTYGTNGFHLPFSDNSTAAALGTDTSGNGNTWTVNNLFTRNVRSLPGVRFGSGVLTAPSSADFNLGTGDFTIEYWLNRSTLGTNDSALTNFSQVSSGFLICLHSGVGFNDATLYLNGAVVVQGGTPEANVWNHYAYVRSGTTCTLYKNGISIASATSSAQAGATNVMNIGAYSDGSSAINGAMSNVRIVKGTAVYTSNFTPTAPLTNVTNTVLLCCQSSSSATAAAVSPGTITATGTPTAGTFNDSSPNEDSLVDSPTSYGTDTGAGGEVRGNYCTWNPVASGSGATLTNGNLDYSLSGASDAARQSRGTFLIPTSGKWYWEHTITTVGESNLGIVDFQTGTFSIYYRDNSGGFQNIYIDGVQTASVASYTNNDVVGVGYDADNQQIRWYKNGAQVGTNYSLTNTGRFVPFAIHGSVSGSCAGSTNFGQRPFAYTAPSGFKALTTANLPTPLIANGATAMDVKLYTGNGSTQAISGLNFSPDLVWLKRRSSAQAHYLYDVIRGTSSVLFSDGTDAEQSISTGLTAFNSDGFSLGSLSGVNASSTTNVAWTWDAGSSTVTNTQGSITSQVRANASAGFSIVKFTPSGAGQVTVGHGLGASPGFIIVKTTNLSANWYQWVTSFTVSEYLTFTTAAKATSANFWGTSLPSSTVFGYNAGGSFDHIAYCFSPVAGYSSFGSYTGNGSADGPFVYTGFRPRWVMVKYTSDAGGHWMIRDAARNTFNAADEALYANLSGATDTGSTYSCDFLSNGFKVRGDYGSQNISAGTYIYAAFAESPFAYARAR